MAEKSSHSRGHRVRRVCAGAVSAGCLVVASLLLPVAPMVAAAAGWSAPVDLAKSYTMTGVSCVSPRFCMAVGAEPTGSEPEGVPMAFVWDGARWASTAALPVPAGTGGWLEGVSCASAHYCLAYGVNLGAVPGETFGEVPTTIYSWDGRTWANTDFPWPSRSVDAISCARTRSCTAVASPGGPVAESGPITVATWDGRTWKSKDLPVSVPGTTPASMSCPAASFCMMVSETDAMETDSALNPLHPNIAYRGGPSGWAPVLWPDDGVGVQTVSCTSSVFCLAIAQNAYNPARPKAVPRSVSFVWDGKAWAERGELPADFADESLSCSSSTFCIAGGYLAQQLYPPNPPGLAERWDGTRWASNSWPSTPGNQVRAVSCVKGDFCMAVGLDALSYN